MFSSARQVMDVWLFISVLTCEARFAYAVIAIDAIFANPVVTWVTGTVINIDLTVGACGKKTDHVKILTLKF